MSLSVKVALARDVSCLAKGFGSQAGPLAGRGNLGRKGSCLSLFGPRPLGGRRVSLGVPRLW